MAGFTLFSGGRTRTTVRLGKWERGGHRAMPEFRVLFVCTGNICRSPSAEAVLRAMLQAEGLAGAVHIESAGTQGYHAGEAPDPRACATARRRGYALESQRARQVTADDYTGFDLILAMDRGHLRQLRRAAQAAGADAARIRLFLDFAAGTGRGRDVPDPYYGGEDGFDGMLDLIEDGARGILALLRRRLRAAPPAPPSPR